MMRAMCVVAVIAVGACDRSRAAPQGGADRIVALEEKVAALERLVANVGRDEASRRADDAALVNRLDEVLWQTGYLRTRGEIEDMVLRKLRRLDGAHTDLVIALGGDGKNRGWWCDDHFCGRTRKECADTTVLTIPQGDPKNCRPAPTAWCSDGETLHCGPKRCAECKLIN